MNLQYIIWTITCLPIFNSGWSDIDHKARIELITTTLLLLKSGEVSYDVKFVILRMLGDLPSLYETSQNHSIELAVTILNGLCGFISYLTGDQSPVAMSRSPGPIKSQMRPGRLASPRTSESEQSPFQRRRTFLLIDSAFLAIFEWVSRVLDYRLATNRSGQAALNKIEEVSVSFLQSISSYFSSQSTNFIEKSLCSNAFRIIDHLLSRAGQYPLQPTESASNCCQLHDRNGSQLFEKEEHFYHYLVDNEVILSIGEMNHLGGGDRQSNTRNTTLLVITRNQFGKYVHEVSSLSSLELHSDHPILLTDSECKEQNPFIPPKNALLTALKAAKANGDLLMKGDPQHPWLLHSGDHELSQLSFHAIQKGLSSPLDITSSWYNPFIARLRRQEEYEKSSDLENSRQPLPQIRDPAGSTQSRNLFLKARHFLTQTRFISSTCHAQVLPITNTRNFMEKLHSLDDCPNRDQLEVWIAYARNDTTVFEEKPHQHIKILTEEHTVDEYNPNYIKFLEGLGWLVDISNHTGTDPCPLTLIMLVDNL